MKSDVRALLADTLNRDPSLLFAYLFGSRATGVVSERSDWDIAVYIREDLLEKNSVWQKFRIEDALASALRTDAVEVVILNRLDDPIFAFEIVNKGIPLIERDRDERMAFECRVLGRYQDWQYIINRHADTAGVV